MGRVKLKYSRRAFTLLELVVSLGIIALLMALLLPAVQSSREAARKAACASNLKQIAVAVHAHEGLHRRLPSGGWGWRWSGDPDRGFGPQQPGGWVYNILPYLEQDELRSAGRMMEPAGRAQILAVNAGVPVAVFNCPSRRSGSAFPFVHPVDFVNMDRPHTVARSDYAACLGDLAPDPSGGKGRGPGSLLEGDSGSFVWHELNRTGIIFRRSALPLGAIADGTANTYLVGEKYLSTDDYYSGKAQNDDQHLLVGYDSDTLRTTDLSYPPFYDGLNLTSDHSFGSAHSEGFNMAMADGSVVFISYEVSLEVHRTRGNRADGGVTSALP